ncbi:hypothetical protein CYMTET_45913 [Cymbomonas tetramitiformis]|uniref:Uncharacterized protein n=1 Tax=Cymbomonas tetramitiformis TaxID=36881 RepID=A0AAE0BZ17_9CHLO|nr:hypothetical protein CYMTET_45913 [Cymbomonas tetramitiformis]
MAEESSIVAHSGFDIKADVSFNVRSQFLFTLLSQLKSSVAQRSLNAGLHVELTVFCKYFKYPRAHPGFSLLWFTSPP